MENEKIILRTYSKAWSYERKLYSFGDIKLPFAINFLQLAYFMIGIILAVIISKMPLLSGLPWVVRYGLLPFGVMKFLSKYKHDGKTPLIWIRDFFSYLARPKVTTRNEPVESYGEGRFQ